MDVNLKKIDHIVVLMMENRSFDNLLGWLYDPDNDPPFNRVPRCQPFNGVSGKNLSNPIPKNAHGSEHKIVPVGKAFSFNTPPFDPGETYPHVNTQLFGTILPPGNHPPFRPPYNLPPVLPQKYPINGFVKDYIAKLECNKQPADYEDYKVIMDCFTPDRVPVISQLAHSYAVCDQWFCSVPSQTLPNRSFFHAGTSSGFVNNEPYVKWLLNSTDTIFNRIESKRDPNVTWKVYYDELDIFSLTLLIHLPKLFKYRKTNFFYMDQFYQDAREGTLPSYAFIEPRFLIDENDQHPPGSVCPGEILINKVYQALRNGKNWEKTLFVLTYDEHGGCYDHVQPPPAVCPKKGCPKGEQDFRFDRLGLRVPTVLVSPYIKAGTVFRAGDKKTCREIPLDHTSIIKTITNRFGLKSLTERDKASKDISQVLTLKNPRTDYPIITPLPCPPSATIDHPLTNLQKGFIEIIATHLSIKVPALETIREALDFLKKARELMEAGGI